MKEQALCIIGNIAAAAGITDYVMENERILKKLFDLIVSVFGGRALLLADNLHLIFHFLCCSDFGTES